MNRFLASIAAVVLALVVAACSSQRPAAEETRAPWVATTRVDPKSLLTLDEIEPRPVLAAAATRPSDSPTPVKALVLYGRAMDDLLREDAADAVTALREALKIDPGSYELYFALGRAELRVAHQPNDRTFDAFEHAAALRPDDLEIHLLLGREYLAAGRPEKALEHLRLALLTEEYSQDQAGATAVDLFLARTLQQQGYDRAALDRYVILIRRINDPSPALRKEPEINFIVTHPQLLWLQIGALYESHGEFAQALAAYEPLAQFDPANFELQEKVVRLLAALGRSDDATRRAADVVERFRGSSESVALLQAVYRMLGREQFAADVLQRLYRRNPGDRGLLFALVDVLVSQRRFDDAQRLLEGAIAKDGHDEEGVEKLFYLYLDHDDSVSAARVLIDHLALDPDSLRQLDVLMGELLRPTRKSMLHMSALQALSVPPAEQAARLYLISRLAEWWQRDALARSSLEQAVKLSPPFAPAFRDLTLDIWSRSELDASQKREACQRLADSAEKGGSAWLAAEVRGLSCLLGGDRAAAAGQFEIAEKLGAASPDFQLTYAGLLRLQGDNRRCEQMLWTLVSKRPRYQEAWASLHDFYLAQGNQAEAIKTMAQWLKADPGSSEARLRQALWYGREGEVAAAQKLLDGLLEDHPDDADVLRVADRFYRELGQSEAYFKKLEAIRARQPENLRLVSILMDDYSKAHRLADATRLLDETRAKVVDNPELLYEVAGLYLRLGQSQVSQDLLAEVIRQDPGNGAASNDLGFAWADAGQNLDRAEQLIRVAIAAEPDNQAFLDSLGWVLYKRGNFLEAARYMELAIGPAALPEPEVLDHYGDVLYRLGKLADATKQWQRALARLEQRGADAGRLQLQLRQKLQESASGKAVNVAPVVESGASAATQREP